MPEISAISENDVVQATKKAIPANMAAPNMPLYRAPMIYSLGPSLTKKMAIMDATIAMAPSTRGNSVAMMIRRIEQISQQHGRNRRYCVSFKQVGRHTGAVSHIVADVVGNGGRVARIVFREYRLQLFPPGRPDISALGEDTAAQPGKDGYQASAKSQGHQCNNGFPGFRAAGSNIV